MNQSEFIKKLLKYESKEDLEKTLASILNLIFHRTSSKGSFAAGWNSSRDAIIELCKLEKFRYDGK